MRASKMNQRGYSLPELLIALALASLVGMAAYTVFTTTSRSTTTQEDVTEAQQNVRVAMDRIAKDIRAAGFGLPDPPFSLSIGGTSHTSPVAITNNDGWGSSDTITLLGIGLQVGTLAAAAGCNASGDGKIHLNSADTDMDVFKTSGAFNVSRRYISLDGVRYFVLKTTQGELGTYNLLLDSPATLDRTYPVGTPVFIIQAIRYTINTSLTGCSSANPCLTRDDMVQDNQVLAMGIEDMQFAFNLQGSASFDNDESSSDIDITSVRVNLIGRSRRQEASGSNVSKRPELEDHAAGAADKYRRRVLTSVVQVRNPRAGS